jgi:flagellar basal body-associated protein FliL
MSILTALVVVMVVAATALVVRFSFLLAKCEDEARGMIHDPRQFHFDGGCE